MADPDNTVLENARKRARRRLVLLSSALGVGLVGLAFTFRDATVLLLERLPMLYRLRRLDSQLVLPVALACAVGIKVPGEMKSPARSSFSMNLGRTPVGLK